MGLSGPIIVTVVSKYLKLITKKEAPPHSHRTYLLAVVLSRPVLCEVIPFARGHGDKHILALSS